MESWFRELTDKAIRRGVFHSVDELIPAINVYPDTHNNDPIPVKWTATADAIIQRSTL